MRNFCFGNVEENSHVKRSVQIVRSSMMVVCRYVANRVSIAKLLSIDGAGKHEGRDVEFCVVTSSSLDTGDQ
jgi:hypothetical protein